MTYATLKKRSEFVRAAQVRNMTRTNTIWVQCFSDKSGDIKQVRAGYTASKKTGNAVHRNRGKRRMRELVRHNLQPVLFEFPNFSGDFVFIAIPATVTCCYAELTKDFKDAVLNCLRRLKS